MTDRLPIGVTIRSIRAEPGWWLESARRLDDAGYAGVWSWDHFMGRGDLTVPVVEGWTILAMAAAATAAADRRDVRRQRDEPPSRGPRPDGLDPPDRERRPARARDRDRRPPEGARGLRDRVSRREGAGGPARGGDRRHPRPVDRRPGDPAVAVLPARRRRSPSRSRPRRRRSSSAARRRPAPAWPAGSATAGRRSTTTSSRTCRSTSRRSRHPGEPGAEQRVLRRVPGRLARRSRHRRERVGARAARGVGALARERAPTGRSSSPGRPRTSTPSSRPSLAGEEQRGPAPGPIAGRARVRTIRGTIERAMTARRDTRPIPSGRPDPSLRPLRRPGRPRRRAVRALQPARPEGQRQLAGPRHGLRSRSPRDRRPRDRGPPRGVGDRPVHGPGHRDARRDRGRRPRRDDRGPQRRPDDRQRDLPPDRPARPDPDPLDRRLQPADRRRARPSPSTRRSTFGSAGSAARRSPARVRDRPPSSPAGAAAAEPPSAPSAWGRRARRSRSTTAAAAGAILMDRYERLERIDHKSATDVVTEADHLSEELVIAAIRARFPGDAILAEESGAHAASATRDRSTAGPGSSTRSTGPSTTPTGCRSSASRSGSSSTAGRPSGAVLDPTRGETFAATADGPATLNGRPIRASGEGASSPTT